MPIDASDHVAKPLSPQEARKVIEMTRDESISAQWAALFLVIFLIFLGAVLCTLIWIKATSGNPNVAAEVYVTVAGGLLVLLGIGFAFYMHRNEKRIAKLKDLAVTFN